MEYGAYARPTKETELRQAERRCAERSHHRQRTRNNLGKVLSMYKAWTEYDDWHLDIRNQSRRVPGTNRDDGDFYDLWTIAEYHQMLDRQKTSRHALARQRGWGSSVRHLNPPGASGWERVTQTDEDKTYSQVLHFGPRPYSDRHFESKKSPQEIGLMDKQKKDIHHC